VFPKDNAKGQPGARAWQKTDMLIGFVAGLQKIGNPDGMNHFSRIFKASPL
jgi:hypothetical protein